MLGSSLDIYPLLHLFRVFIRWALTAVRDCGMGHLYVILEVVRLRLLVTAAYIIATTQVVAAPVLEYGIMVPPIQYGMGEFIAPPVIFHLPGEDVTRLCRELSVADPVNTSKDQIEACVVFYDGDEPLTWQDRDTSDTCRIYVDVEMVEVLAYHVVVEHEFGHCRGWPPDHPY
jgi:hypothetical protein